MFYQMQLYWDLHRASTGDAMKSGITPQQATSLKPPERGKGVSGKKEKVIHSLSDFATSGLAFYLCDV